MQAILDKIEFQGLAYSEITDLDVKAFMTRIATQLYPMESEIKEHIKATIVLRRGGIVILDSFPPDISNKMKSLLV